MKIMICQPTNNLEQKQSEKIRDRTTRDLIQDGHTVIDTLTEFKSSDLTKEGIKDIPMYLLAKSIEAMSMVDGVCFCAGWETDRRCRIEHTIAEKYGLIITEAR